MNALCLGYKIHCIACRTIHLLYKILSIQWVDKLLEGGVQLPVTLAGVAPESTRGAPALTRMESRGGCGGPRGSEP